MSENENTYANGIKESFELLDNNDKFKEIFREEQFKILIKPEDEKHAALVIVDKGTIKVEKIVNKPEENISKDVLGWDGLVQTTGELFGDLDSGKAKAGKLILKRKLKLKNPKVLVKLSKIQALIERK